MDAVKSFNAELSSLYEVKPPISKAKMTALTRGAIKAIKFYKHVVQSVEKFILKCKSEYKVPGLYVIDSIVRQSRHQFGADKDVFAPRFAKNMQQTFINLFQCPPEDKSKVIRVLNLWQKNQVFAPDVIQPLFDLADPNHPIHKELNAASVAAASGAVQNNGIASQSAIIKGSPALQKTPTKTGTGCSADQAALAQQLGNISNNPNALDPNTLVQLQQLHRLVLRQQQQQGEAGKQEGQVHFDRKLLDFDYGSDEDDDPTNPSPKPNNAAIDNVGSLLSNPEVLRQLQTLQQTMNNSQPMHAEYDLEKLRKLQEMKQQEEEFDKHLAQTLPNLPFAAECEFKPSNTNSPALPAFFLPTGTDLSQPPPGYKPPAPYELSQPDDNAMESEVEFIGTNDDVEVIDIDHGDSRSPSRDRYRRRRSRSNERSRDRGGRDRRSRRSRSRSRSRSRRYRSRSRDREREKEKEKEKDREKEKERRKRGLPPIKKDNLSVCSTTLWVGHLSKLVHQEDLSDTFGEFGEIVSIDLIIPRGCAFIVMHRRQDAARCLTKLKNHKMQGKAITLAWAPGKGVKGKDLKDYWEGDLGVSYIPFSKLKPDIDMELLEDGGMVDEDTVPNWLKDKMTTDSTKNDISEHTNSSVVQLTEIGTPVGVDTSQPPPVPGGGLLQAPPMGLSLVPQFQLNNRLLGIPPGLMPNVPMGVPPPSLMPNQMMGIGSPFGQGLLQPPMSQLPPLDKSQSEVSGIPEQLLPFGLLPPQPPPLVMPPQHDDNMDIEMEDADKSDSKLNDSFNGSDTRSLDELRRGDGRNHSHDRDRDMNRMLGRGRRDSRERRDRENERDSRSGERRDRIPNNRWGDPSRRDIRDGRDDRRDREKALNDRLREMAGDNSFKEQEQHNNHPPPLLERPIFPFNSNEPPMDYVRRRHDDFPSEFEGPPIEYEPPVMDFDGPPMEFDGQIRPMIHPRDTLRFEERRRGPLPPDFAFMGPRGPRFRPDGYGPRGMSPMMRPHMFHPRGPPPPHMRGPRPGGPPEFYRGGPPFDDSPHLPSRHRPRRFRPDFDGEPSADQSFDRPERRSRWGNNSISEDNPPSLSESGKDDCGDVEEEVEGQLQNEDNEVVGIEVDDEGDVGGNTTPLHDEPSELGGGEGGGGSNDEIVDDKPSAEEAVVNAEDPEAAS
ncbi:PREDICTED: splicing factor, arginine/serine-rich 15 isoform X2 [Nicrophorus vespilloides]|uniref:Splicing factor, arginine/serine-rich 15 isoform X2 n=1 Tax=Nicrophorus vespilloides TaxID=110193 RepID=A0ABM1MLA4_NICVS|nr:PREDICTED: splicing factor, arginine/serine-rich 15 isoform X2 [Nicrophorus vespilloides]